MVFVSVAGRQNSTIIGGQNWSDFIVEFAPIRGALEEDGILSVTGTMTIAKHPDNPSSIDPLLNAALWKRSQSVRLQVANDAGTLIDHPFGYLFILKVPILSTDGQLLTVEVGDYLALANKREVPGDNSGVTLGTAVDFSVICQNYLESAGIPTANINLGSAWGYDKAISIPKDNFNALAMAGKIAYASDFRVLYQDSAGVVRVHQVTVTPGTPSLSFNASVIPAEWLEPEFQPATAPELVKVEAVGETVTAVTTPITDTQSSTDLEIFTSSSYVFSSFGEYIFGNLTITISNVDARREEQRREKQPESVVFGNSSSIKVVTDDTIDRYFYEDIGTGSGPYRLKAKISVSEQAAGIIDGDENAIPETYRIVFEGWEFDSDGVITSHNVTTYARQKEYAPDDTFGLQWRIIKSFDEDWQEQTTNSYKYQAVTKVAAVTQSQSFNALNDSNKWALRTTAFEGKPAREQGDNTPPAPDLWEGPYNITEQNYSGQATYTPPGGASSITATEVIEITEGLGISDAVCASMAAKWAQIYGGKEYAMALTLPVNDALLAIDSPLFQVTYTVDGRVRTYLVDAQAYSHTFDESICEALGILIGDVAA